MSQQAACSWTYWPVCHRGREVRAGDRALRQRRHSELTSSGCTASCRSRSRTTHVTRTRQSSPRALTARRRSFWRPDADSTWPSPSTRSASRCSHSHSHSPGHVASDRTTTHTLLRTTWRDVTVTWYRDSRDAATRLCRRVQCLAGRTTSLAGDVDRYWYWYWDWDWDWCRPTCRIALSWDVPWWHGDI